MNARRIYARRFAFALSLTVAAWFALGYAAASIMYMPKPSPFEDRADIDGRPVESIVLKTQDGVPISAWYLAGDGDRAVVLAHGISASRKQSVANAEHYLARGYGAVLLDHRGHGNNAEGGITAGYDERFDVLAARDFLVQKGYKHIGAHGVSMGASAIAYTMLEDTPWNFVVLQQCYDTIEHALNNRLDMFHVPHIVVYPFRFWSEFIMGVSAEQMRPVDMAAKMTMPTLIIAGDSEAELKVHETMSLYEACPAENKHMRLFKGGRHNESLARKYADEFTEVMTAFLNEVEGVDAAAPTSVAAAPEAS
ncbi:MAG: hypothetical protein GC168_01300 [Candidatus Hydrogenedens sp.]|nr:hypothetical protein [Candidatus Hydrogenedens sp.]